MAEEETSKVSIDPSAALAGLALITTSLTVMLGAATGVGAAFAAWKIGDSVFTSMRTAESQIIRLQTALQSAVAGVNEYTKSMAFAAKTPFPVESVIEAAAQLRVFQVDPFKEVEAGGRNVLEVLGDMSGAMGKDVSTAVHALTRAMTGEWEIMKNNFQITSRMIPKLGSLTSGTKEYAKAILDYLAKQDRFRGGMELTAKSINGMMSNLGDAIDLMLMGAGGVADSAAMLKGGTLYDSVRGAIQLLYNVVSDDSAVKAFGRNLQFANEETKAALDRLKLTEEETKLLGEAWKQFPDDEIKRIDFLISNGMDMSRVLSQGEKFTLWGRMFGQVMKVTFDVFILPSFERMRDMIGAFLEQGVKVINMLVPIQKIPETTQLSAKQAHELIVKLAGDTTGLSQEVIDKTEQMLIASKTRSERQMIIFMILMEIYKQIFLAVLDAWKAGIMAWLDGAGGAFSKFTARVIDNWESMKLGDRLLAMFSGIGSALSGVLGTIAAVAGGILEGVFTQLVEGGVLDNMMEVMGNVFDTVGALGRIIGTVFGPPLQAGLNKIGQILGNLFVQPLRIGSAILDGIWGFIREIVVGLEEWGIIELFSAALNDIVDAAGMILGAFGEVVDVIMDAFGFGGSGGGNALKDFGKALANVILVAIKAIVIAVRVLAFAIKMVVGFVALLIDAWTSLLRWVTGTTDKFNLLSEVSEVIKETWEDITDALSDAWRGLTDFLSSIGGGISSNLQSMLSPVVQVFQGIKDGILGLFTGVFDWIQGKFRQLGEWWSNSAVGRAFASASGGNQQQAAQPAVSRAIGDWNVPRDMAALIHKGEMIIPANEADMLRRLFAAPAGSPLAGGAEGQSGGGAGESAVSQLAARILQIMAGVAGSFKEFGGTVKNVAREVNTLGAVSAWTSSVSATNAETLSANPPAPTRPATADGTTSAGEIPVLLFNPSTSEMRRVNVSSIEEAVRKYGQQRGNAPDPRSPGAMLPFFNDTGLAAGAFNVPTTMVTRVHADEMVLPARFADAVRSELRDTAPATVGARSNPVVVNNYFQAPVAPAAVAPLNRAITKSVENMRLMGG